MSAAAIPSFTAEQYFEIDDASEVKSELIDGQIVPLAEDAIEHEAISTQISYLLRAKLAGTSCRALSNPRVSIPRVKKPMFCRPDMAVDCGAGKLTGRTPAITNPVLIAEVLSPSTSGYDTTAKFDLYRRLDSLKDYLLVSQDEPRIAHYGSQPDRSWVMRVYTGLDAVMPLPSLNVALALGDVYADLEFKEE